MAFGADTPMQTVGTVETTIVDSRVVACDGGLANLGHPRVWLRIVGAQTFCPYCSRVYVLAEGAPAAAAH